MHLKRLSVVLLCAFIWSAQAGEASKLLKPGTDAPPFSLPSLDGGRRVLRVWCGDSLLKPYMNSVKHVIVLNFWATYCKPCQKEIPQIAAFLKKHEGEPVKAFFVSIDKEGVQKVRPFIEKEGYQVEVLLDMYARTAQRYGVKSVPALFVISPDGKIHYAASGFDKDANLTVKLESIYQAAKAGKTPARSDVEVMEEQVEADTEAHTADEDGPLPARERWRAVVRVECGEDVSDVAEELGIPVSNLRNWEIGRASCRERV
jgi:thiol-disulfide isomerase/thioredoxin